MERCRIRVGRHVLEADVASSVRDKTIGFMAYDTIGPHQAMLFPYAVPQEATYHMAEVAFPIDILFLKGGDENPSSYMVKRIVHNAQPGDKDHYTCPGTLAVLEVPGGFCRENHVDVGERVVLESGLGDDEKRINWLSDGAHTDDPDASYGRPYFDPELSKMHGPGGQASSREEDTLTRLHEMMRKLQRAGSVRAHAEKTLEELDRDRGQGPVVSTWNTVVGDDDDDDAQKKPSRPGLDGNLGMGDTLGLSMDDIDMIHGQPPRGDRDTLRENIRNVIQTLRYP